MYETAIILTILVMIVFLRLSTSRLHNLTALLAITAFVGFLLIITGLELPGLILLLVYNGGILVLFAIGIMTIDERTAELDDHHNTVGEWFKALLAVNCMVLLLVPSIFLRHHRKHQAQIKQFTDLVNSGDLMYGIDDEAGETLDAIWQAMISTQNEFITTLGIILAGTIITCMIILKR